MPSLSAGDFQFWHLHVLRGSACWFPIPQILVRWWITSPRRTGPHRWTCMKSGKVIRVILFVFILGQGPLRSGQNPAHQAAKGRRIYDVIMMYMSLYMSFALHAATYAAMASSRYFKNMYRFLSLIPLLLSGVSVLVNISKMSVHWNWSRFGDFMCSGVSILVSSWPAFFVYTWDCVRDPFGIKSAGNASSENSFWLSLERLLNHWAC